MSGHVFISYSRTDRSYVDELAGRLRDAGIPVWYDLGLSAGQRFDDVITKSIDACVAFVVVLTPESVASNWVQDEIGYAIFRGKEVVPLQLRPSEPLLRLINVHGEKVGEGQPVPPQVVSRLRELVQVPAPAEPGIPGYAVLDLETTGLSPSKDRIVEVAIVRTDSVGRAVDEWVTLLDPEQPISPKAAEVNGLTPADLSGAPHFGDVAGQLAKRLAGRVLVAHNAKFDLAFLEAEFARAGHLLPEQVPVLCTLEASLHYLPWLERRRLADCCRAVGVPLRHAHSALGDTIATAKLLESYLDGRTGTPAHAHHLELPALAARVAWPAIPTDREAPGLRSRGALRPAPAPPGRLAGLLKNLPLSTEMDDRAPSAVAAADRPDADRAYVELLAEVLEDRVVTREEAEKLGSLATAYSMARERVAAAQRSLMLALAHKAVADGKVTRAEREDLARVAETLGLDDGIVQEVLGEAKAAYEAALNAATRPLPGDWPFGEPLRVGMSVAFTGCDEVERARLEGRARAAGLRVTSCVSGRTAMLVTDGANPNTRKAVAARTRGTRTVTPETFAQVVQYVQPAPDQDPPREPPRRKGQVARR